ncbi:MAG: glycosyltransferase [Candidatus Curtissbacteria bacterium GW2011_GWA1_40_16]|uniref:Glycosyltransferase n=1 Tax=Candidatus Curtissbacteria bacterium GW2011_GWA1_40_16 TaxID=1618405 RepID=A0A0G0TWD3_9BACT|nr:MAG: glycosyltransferase [Candidatus Curtissbacteria bacterium GW2011_GWA1_40_16]
MRLVVNIPTYNEEDNIREVIKRVLASGSKMPELDLHVLVSDSHSPDKTSQIVKEVSKTNPKVHYLDVKERGLGIGIVKGHRFAIDKLKADILAQMDGDLSHDPATLPHMVKYIIEDGFDLVVGSRLMKGGKNLLGWHRRLFTRGSAFYCKFAWGTFSISEYTNSYRVFTKELFESINFKKVPWKSKTYIIQPAFLYAALLAGARVKEIPITFEDRKKGYSKAKITSYTLDVLRFGVKVRIERSKTFFKFLSVGTLTYFINAVLLGLLYRGNIYSTKILPGPILSFIPVSHPATKLFSIYFDRLFVASIISIEASIIVNFIFHENWTFKHRNREGAKLKRFLKFNLSSAGSPVIQLASILMFAQVLHVNEQIGLAVGVLIGLFVNYTVNLLWIWKEHPEATNNLLSNSADGK